MDQGQGKGKVEQRRLPRRQALRENPEGGTQVLGYYRERDGQQVQDQWLRREKGDQRSSHKESHQTSRRAQRCLHCLLRCQLRQGHQGPREEAVSRETRANGCCIGSPLNSLLSLLSSSKYDIFKRKVFLLSNKQTYSLLPNFILNIKEAVHYL